MYGSQKGIEKGIRSDIPIFREDLTLSTKIRGGGDRELE